MKEKLSLIFILLGVAMLAVTMSADGATIQVRVGDGRFNPESQKPVIYQQNDGTILQTIVGPDHLQLSITRPDALPVSIALPDDMAQAESINPAADGKAVVIGMVNSSVYEVVLVDTPKDRIADQFLAYSPAISPNGRFIAFIKFYPAHFVEGVSDHVMVYDFSRSPAANRPRGVGRDEDTNVGTAVYPPGIRTQDPNTGVPETAANRVLSKTFFWAPDSSKFVFATEHAPGGDQTAGPTNIAMPVKGEMSLVLVDLGVSRAPPRVSVFTTSLCATEGASCEQRLESIEFGSSGLTAQFRGFGSMVGRQQSFYVSYDQFHSP